MKQKHPLFTADELNESVNAYFKRVTTAPPSKQHPTIPEKKLPAKSSPKKPTNQGEEAPTITGLAYFLGFSSLAVFDEYTRNGKYAEVLKRARLRIEAEYEQKLHLHSSGGAIFALKSLGWNEKTEDKTAANPALKPLKIKFIETGPPPASTEKEVVL